jgi:hypothetical protein
MYKVGGKIVSVGNKFPENRINTLTFESTGSTFPNFNRSFSSFIINFSNPMSFRINYGDGVVESFTNQSSYSIRANQNPGDVHEYIDGNTSSRFVTFEFESLLNIVYIQINFVSVIGFFPVEVGLIKNLNGLSLRSTNFDSFPESFFDLRKLTRLSLDSALSFQFPAIFDGIFLNPITSLTLDTSFNLSDHISSNFFKINQLKDTLTFLNIQGADLEDLPKEIEELQELTEFWGLFSLFSAMPPEVLALKKLENLKLGNFSRPGGLVNTAMLEFGSNSNKITTLSLRLRNVDLFDLSTKWLGLKSLKQIEQFQYLVGDTARFDEFINQIYILSTVNGFLNTSSTEAQLEEFPEQFRDIVWGDSSLTQTGIIEAPPQFVQGSNNGNPINQGQKIYVLVNNYGHTITTS